MSDGRHRLRYIVWDRDAERQFYIRRKDYYGLDSQKEERIKSKFSALCKREKKHLRFQDPNAYFAVSTDILDDLLSDIQEKATPQIEQYLNSIPEVKKVAFFSDSVHVFYETDEDIDAHEKDGLSQTIERSVHEMKKAFDEFHACKNGGTVFTSIQTLNEKFEGSIFFYLR